MAVAVLAEVCTSKLGTTALIIQSPGDVYVSPLYLALPGIARARLANCLMPARDDEQCLCRASRQYNIQLLCPAGGMANPSRSRVAPPSPDRAGVDDLMEAFRQDVRCWGRTRRISSLCATARRYAQIELLDSHSEPVTLAGLQRKNKSPSCDEYR